MSAVSATPLIGGRFESRGLPRTLIDPINSVTQAATLTSTPQHGGSLPH
jgi:hypothetical protein